MDARTERLGEHAAAWRELSGYHNPADLIGPEPAATASELRAAYRDVVISWSPSYAAKSSKSLTL
jgi:hypothetical protein